MYRFLGEETEQQAEVLHCPPPKVHSSMQYFLHQRQQVFSYSSQWEQEQLLTMPQLLLKQAINSYFQKKLSLHLKF